MQGEAIAEHWTDEPFSTLALWQKGAFRHQGGTGRQHGITRFA